LRFTSTGQGKTDSLQNVPVQPVPVGQTHAPQSQAPPLAAHAGSHGDRSQEQSVLFQPASHEQTPHSQLPRPAQGRPLAAGAHGENEMLQWAPLKQLLSSQMHSPQTHALARGLPVHSALHEAVLHSHSKPSQPASHWQTEQLHAPLPLQVWPRPSSGHATMLSLQ
jgi:hypothetical protein